jgi:hypothetical protein
MTTMASSGILIKWEIAPSEMAPCVRMPAQSRASQIAATAGEVLIDVVVERWRACRVGLVARRDEDPACLEPGAQRLLRAARLEAPPLLDVLLRDVAEYFQRIRDDIFQSAISASRSALASSSSRRKLPPTAWQPPAERDRSGPTVIRAGGFARSWRSVSNNVFTSWATLITPPARLSPAVDDAETEGPWSDHPDDERLQR